MVFRLEIRCRQQAGFEIIGRCNRSLLGVGIESDLLLIRVIVCREQSLMLQPLLEILSHDRFADAAAQRQLRCAGRPVDPLMRGCLSEHGILRAERSTDIVAAQHHDLFQFISLTGKRVRDGFRGRRLRILILTVCLCCGLLRLCCKLRSGCCAFRIFCL